jgi:predicted dinucleotide-utilizing enzyme
MQLTLQNFPHPENPSTSYLACLGPIAALTNMQGAIRFF